MITQKFATWRQLWKECGHEGPMPRTFLTRAVHVAETDALARAEAHLATPRMADPGFSEASLEMIGRTRPGYGPDGQYAGEAGTPERLELRRVFRELNPHRSLSLTPKEYFRRNCWAAVEGSEPEIEATARLMGADRMCVSTDYPHFDSNFPNVSNNVLANVPREMAAQIFMGGAHLYGFIEADFAKADAATAANRKLTAVSVGK